LIVSAKRTMEDVSRFSVDLSSMVQCVGSVHASGDDEHECHFLTCELSVVGRADNIVVHINVHHRLKSARFGTSGVDTLWKVLRPSLGGIVSVLSQITFLPRPPDRVTIKPKFQQR
jgi:hypothetical protein